MNNKHKELVHADNPKGKDYFAIRWKIEKYKKNFVNKRKEKAKNFIK